MSIYEDVQRSATATRCRCDLKPVKTQQELRHLGAGCTDPWYACPTLSKYRRLLPQTPVEVVLPAAPAAPQERARAKPRRYDPFASQVRGQ